MRISDWSSDVCSSDLEDHEARPQQGGQRRHGEADQHAAEQELGGMAADIIEQPHHGRTARLDRIICVSRETEWELWAAGRERSEEHTSELQSLMRISYAVFCLKKTRRQTDMATEK